MAKLFIILLCSFGAIYAIPSESTYLIPEHRGDLQVIASEPVRYEYQIVPKDQYAVMESKPKLSLSDFLLSPVTALISLGSTALSLSKWLLINGGLVFLGIAIMFGFCAFTSFCTLTINSSFVKNLGSVSFLDDIEYYFHEAFNKVHDMQRHL